MKNTWRFGEREFNYVREVLDSGFGSGTSGGMNNRFEQAFAKTIGAKFAITFNSGTSTLHAALDACGVGAGDEVIIPPLTVISDVDVILAQNAVPIFADIDPDTFNMDPADTAKKITKKTKAIMPVSLYGVSCDLDPFMKLAEKHGIYVINDAAQAFMSQYKGRPIAEIAHITSYSLENSKHITTGDGGIVVTNDEVLAEKMRKFGSLGYAALKSKDGRIRLNKDIFQDPTYKRHDAFGYNYRMPEVAAGVGLAQTERIKFFIDLRLGIAKMYEEVIKEIGCKYLIAQKIPAGCNSTYWCYTVKYVREDISWQDFRKKYMEFGGDGIYAAWALIYEETFMATGIFKQRCPHYYKDIEYKKGLCPNAEKVQPSIMQFVNNYGSLDEARPKVEALKKTIQYFK
ncbi:DegT/DnrJ/EryC1/StrS aminotransferase [Candidatus Omnitrophus magneticus]|uniref:DegT/DnrJ/EryC1/StrS aminotransferase n=1 Tax=Candidatus Omnitrophus magneticus TaxID=1609969 RepID=A0A0F0CTR5_9BACT|nr:DegT/DnrJ/EryC1/StrS aminotransferase [Candidatus Omnitrophus magneticus]